MDPVNRPEATELDGRAFSTLWMQWVESVRLHVVRLLGLVTLEARYSLWNIGLAFGLLLIMVIAGLSMWGLLLAGLSLFLHDTGLSWSLVLPAIALLNLLLAASAWYGAQACLGRVGFSRTARVLGLDEDDHVDS